MLPRILKVTLLVFRVHCGTLISLSRSGTKYFIFKTVKFRASDLDLAFQIFFNRIGAQHCADKKVFISL